MARATARKGTWTAPRFGAALLAAWLPACGGDHVTAPTPPPPSPSPVPVTSVIAEGSFSGLPPQLGVAGTFTTTVTGDLEFIVDWTFATNNLDLLLFRGECSEDQFNAGQCTAGDTADSSTAKPERVGISSAPAGVYTLVVFNLGDTEESFSYQVLLTTAGSASKTGGRSSSLIAGPRWGAARLRPRTMPRP